MKRSFKYRGYKIRPHRVSGLRFAEILNRYGDYWDETRMHKTTKAAVKEGQQLIDNYIEDQRGL